MRLHVASKLAYTMERPVDLLVQIEVAAMPEQTVTNATFEPGGTAHMHRISAEDSIGTRVWLHCEGKLDCSYNAEIEITRTPPQLATLVQDPVHQLPHEAVRYLMASRYCPADEFQSYVNSEFGHLSGGAAIAEMAAWIERKFIYSPGASSASTTAVDTFVQRRGICRDFAHVMISMARAAAIPARMVSCYGPDVSPQDFHAVAEVWLEGGWHLVDATGMAKADEIAIVGVGRDAADIAFLTSYGWIQMENQSVEVKRL